MRTPSLESADLREAAAGDRQAREHLTREVLPCVLQWCARLGGPRVDPEDAAHEVILVMLDRLSTVENEAQFRAWLFGITRRVLAAHRRRAWFRRWLPGAAADGREDERASPFESAHRNETADLVRAALESLSEDHRVILVLADAEGRSESEIGELLALPIGTVRSRISRGRKALLAAAPRFGLQSPTLQVMDGGA